MNIGQKKLGLSEKSKSFMATGTRELFMPEEMESVKLNSLRHRRKELEDKLKLISNRISFRRKKEEDELRRYIRTEERSRAISETKNFKKVNSMVREELSQKRAFEQSKKAKEVEDFRMTNSRRLHLIYQSVRDKKLSESEKVRQLKRMDEELISASRTEALQEVRDRHDQVQKMKERQVTKKKCYWLEKRLTFQQNLIDETAIYEHQIQDYYRKIDGLKRNQEELREKEEHALEVLKCAEQNYQLLRQS